MTVNSIILFRNNFIKKLYFLHFYDNIKRIFCISDLNFNEYKRAHTHTHNINIYTFIYINFSDLFSGNHNTSVSARCEFVSVRYLPKVM